MNAPLFIFMLFSIQACCYLVGKKSIKKVDSDGDYYLTKDAISFVPLVMTFLATQVGGGLILGSCDEAYRFGWHMIFYPLGSAFGLVVLGIGFGKKLAKFNVKTIAEIFEVIYKSSNLKKVASILSVLSLFITLIAQLTASYHFLSTMGLTNIPLYYLFWLLVIFYTSRGGLRAVVSTDVIQVAFFIFIFFACGISLYAKHSLPQFESDTSFQAPIVGWFLMPLLFILIAQDMGQRCFTGDRKIVSLASFIAGILMSIVCIVPVYIGVLAKSLKIEIPQDASVLLYTVHTLTNSWVTSLVGCAVLAAIISTVTSLINAISSNIVNDFVKTQQIRSIRLITFVFSTLAIPLSLYFNNIVSLMIFAYEISVSTLFVPIFFSLFKKNGDFYAALLSILMGFFSFFLFRKTPSFFIPKEIATLAVSFVGFGLGSILQRWVIQPNTSK